MMFKKKSIFLLIFSVFLVSLSYSFYFKIRPSVDARAYDAVAYNLIKGMGYRESPDVSLEEDYAIVRVGPGYQFFLAGLYYVFGHRYWPIWIIQALLLALSAFLVFLLSKEIFRSCWDPKIGLLAAALVGFSPDLITISAMLLSETLAVFLALLSIYVFFRYLDRKKMFWLVVLGAIFGFSVLVRTPLALFFFPFSAFFIKDRRWLHFFVFTAVLAFVFLPWVLRNYSVYNKFILANEALGHNLIMGNHPGASGELKPYPALEENIKKYGPVKAGEIGQKEALEFIFSHPLEFIKLTFYRISIYFSFSRPTGFWPHLSGFSRIITLFTSSFYSLLIFTLGFIGISQIKKIKENGERKSRYFLAMLVLMPMSIVWIAAETRYRFIIYPFLAVFGAYALSLLKTDWRAIKRVGWLIFGVLFLNTGFDVLRNLPEILKRMSELGF